MLLVPRKHASGAHKSGLWTPESRLLLPIKQASGRHKAGLWALCGAVCAENILMDRNRYVGDVVGEFVKAARSGTVTSKLLLKKRFFRPSDSGSTNRVYLQLCYVQVLPQAR